MRYFLKKDLPGIKAGSLMRQSTANTHWWYDHNSEMSLLIPPDETTDWIEERDVMWKPQEGEKYYIPNMHNEDGFQEFTWAGDVNDLTFLRNGRVCSSAKAAMALNKHLIKSAKEWQEKQV